MSGIYLAVSEHMMPLIAPRHHTEHLHSDTLVAHALAWLAYRTELADRAGRGRYVTAVDALAAGASFEQVGDAMGGVSPEDVRRDIGAWAAGQRGEGLMTVARYVAVLDLIGEVPE